MSISEAFEVVPPVTTSGISGSVCIAPAEYARTQTVEALPQLLLKDMPCRKAKKKLFHHRKRHKIDEIPKRLRTNVEPGKTIVDDYVSDHNYCLSKEDVQNVPGPDPHPSTTVLGDHDYCCTNILFGRTSSVGSGCEIEDVHYSESLLSEVPVHCNDILPTITTELAMMGSCHMPHSKRVSPEMESADPGEWETVPLTDLELETELAGVDLCTVIEPLENSVQMEILESAASCDNSHDETNTCEIIRSKENDLANDSVPTHGNPSNSLVDPSTWSTLQSMVEAFLPPSWITHKDGEEISVSMLSTAVPKVIQRTVLVSSLGAVRVSVHGHFLLPTHEIFNILPVFPTLSTNTVKTYADKIATCIAKVRLMEICVGANAPELKRWWKRTPKTVIDSNNFKETKYLECCRSINCCLIISQQRLRCKNCAAVQKVLRNRGARNKSSGTGTPKSKKPDKVLTTPEAAARASRRKKITRNLREQNRRLRLKISELLDCEGVDIDTTLSKDLTDVFKKKGMTEFEKLFIEQQIRASKVHSPCGRRWHPSMIKFALDIYLHSKTTYDVLKRYIKLPSERTLFDYSHLEKPQEGLCQSTVNEIANKLSSMKEYQSYHVLYYDEIYISRNLVYKKHTGEIVGFCSLSKADGEILEIENMLKNESDPACESPARPIASKILTFMCNGVSSGLCEVVANFTESTLTKESLFQKHWSVVETLEIAGIKVIGSVGDGNAVNRGFINLHHPKTPTTSGVIFDTVNMYADDRVFYFFSDPPHLLKTIRNCFCSTARELEKKNEKIKWSFIHALYYTERGQSLRLLHKLTAASVNLTSYSRMRVIYAAQVLSQSVANALRGTGWKNVEQTALFVEKVNQFFDCLNGNYSSDGYFQRKKELYPYRRVDDIRFKILDNFLAYLEEWKAEVDATSLTADEKQRKMLSQQTLEGIEMTVRSFTGAVKYLLKCGTKFIMARVFCQDYLEHYFSRQRARCGGSNNPNVDEFLRNVNTFKILGKVGVRRKSGNVQVDDPGPSVDDTPLPKRKSSKCKKSLMFAPENDAPENNDSM